MKVLIAEDDLTSRLMLQALARQWGLEVVAVSDGEEALARLQEQNSPKLALLDWMMPGMDGLEVVRKLRGKDESEPHYIIMLTSRDEKRDIAEALNAGADDYITKPFDNQELLARIGVGFRVTRLEAALAARVRELDKANATIQHLACTDELTGLPNRRSFNDRLSKEVSAATRHGYALALIMADIDHFKRVNDSFGHDVGDHVLQTFADVMMRTARLEDFPARWGGEEFAILLPHTPAEGGSRLAERLRLGCSQARYEGVDLTLSASFGVAALLEGESCDSLVKRADSALRVAKQQGRNRVVVSSPNKEATTTEAVREQFA